MFNADESNNNNNNVKLFPIPILEVAILGAAHVELQTTLKTTTSWYHRALARTISEVFI